MTVRELIDGLHMFDLDMEISFWITDSYINFEVEAGNASFFEINEDLGDAVLHITLETPDGVCLGDIA